MIPGPKYVYECSRCSGPISYRTMASGNTFNSILWSDGKLDAPMMPDQPAAVICPHCRELVWLQDLKNLGPIPGSDGFPHSPSEDDPVIPENHQGYDEPGFADFISALAETNRPPFDLPEAESELVAGYQVEYSSTPFLLYMAGEYIAIWLMCALTSILFFGGWLSPIPGIPDSPLWLVGKMCFFFFLFAMVKAIVPRFRYDQLMRLGWKVFLPMSLGWIVLVAFFVQYEVFGGAYVRWVTGG